MSIVAESKSLRIGLLSSFEDAQQISSDWNRLSLGVPFRRWEWHAAWWRAYGTPHKLFVMTAHDGTRIVGIAPFFVERVHPVGSVVRFMGSGDVCSDQQSLLVEPGYETTVSTAFAEWLLSDVKNDRGAAKASCDDQSLASPPWDLLEFNGMDVHAPTMDVFLTELQASDFNCHRRSPVNTWRIPLPPTMEEYMSHLSKPSRRKVRSALKRFESCECRVTFADTDKEFAQIWPAFVLLHQRRRQSLGDPGCFTEKAFGDFLYEAANEFRRNGKLDLACITLDNKPIATELCFRGESITFAYQIGIDPDALPENPGWLVNTASIQRAIELGQSAFDLCRGDQEYKHHLGAQPHPCEECRVVPPKLRSQLWDAALVTQTAVKDWLKAGLSISGIR